MKKFSKLSLATAIALGSMGSLSADFIDSSTFTGYTEVRLDMAKSGDAKKDDMTKERMRFRLNVKTQMNENAYSMVRLEANNASSNSADKDMKGSGESADSVALKKAFISFKMPGNDMVSFKAGRDWSTVYDSYANGFQASVDLGMASVGAKYRVNGGVESPLMGVFGSFSAEGFMGQFDYISFSKPKVSMTKSEMFAKGSYTMDGITVTGAYASTTPESGDKGSYMGAMASYEMSGITVSGVFGKTDKKGGVANLAYSHWSDYNLYASDVTMDLLWGTGLQQGNVIGHKDASTMAFNVGGSMAGLDLGAGFATNEGMVGENTKKSKVTEMSVSASKELAKSLKGYVQFASLSKHDDTKQPAHSNLRFKVKYSF